MKTYFDTMEAVDVEDPNKFTTVTNKAFFVGYRVKNQFKIGAEYNVLKNATTYKSASADRDLIGLSYYATYFVNKKWNVFGRFDQLSSSRIVGENNNWNYSNDGKTYIVGFEHNFSKGVNTSMNYRFTNFEDVTNKTTSSIYFNLEFFF